MNNNNLPKNVCRCLNTACPDRANCHRFMGKGSGAKIPVFEFPTPENSGKCSYFILHQQDK